MLSSLPLQSDPPDKRSLSQLIHDKKPHSETKIFKKTNVMLLLDRWFDLFESNEKEEKEKGWQDKETAFVSAFVRIRSARIDVLFSRNMNCHFQSPPIPQVSAVEPESFDGTPIKFTSLLSQMVIQRSGKIDESASDPVETPKSEILASDFSRRSSLPSASQHDPIRRYAHNSSST